MSESIDINAKAQEILKNAEAYGTEKNFLFITTFKRYIMQLQLLQQIENEIKQAIKDNKLKSEKSLISDYNSTASAANKTASTLQSIVSKSSENFFEI